MENASKALILTGEILIAVLVLSLASYIVTQFGTFSRTLNEKMERKEISEFNVKFTNYSGRADINVQDLVTAINLANQRNKEYDASPSDAYYVEVLLDGKSILSSNINELLETNKNNTYYYCNLDKLKIIKKDDTIELSAVGTENDIVYDANTELVSRIEFHTIKGNNAEEYVKAILEGKQLVWNVN